jgi:hypothetical protein
VEGGPQLGHEQTTMDDDLIALHDRHHERLRDLLFVVIERLVRMDIAGAIAVFDRFERELRAGLAVEDDVVLPAYRLVDPVEGPGRAVHVEGDHVILLRGIGFVRAYLDDVAATRALRPILEGLPHVYRLLGTLEHHTERERRHVYPAAVPRLAVDDAARLALVLHGLVDDTALP